MAGCMDDVAVVIPTKKKVHLQIYMKNLKLVGRFKALQSNNNVLMMRKYDGKMLESRQSMPLQLKA